MTLQHETPRERLLELLADDCIDTLEKEEHHELQSLLPRFTDVSPLTMEYTAAAIDLAFTADRIQPMPSDVRGRVEADVMRRFEALAGQESAATVGRPFLGDRAASQATAATAIATARRASWIDRAGWLAAAACLVLAVYAWWPPTAGEQGVSQLRARVEASPDLIQASWSPQAKLGDVAVTGDFVWSPSRQEGCMRFEGLPVNDPSVEQYQLWLIDETQDHPIDGGVFDVTESGSIDIAIVAKLGVKSLKAAAITIEKPGGVVVSKQEELILLAPVDS